MYRPPATAPRAAAVSLLFAVSAALSACSGRAMDVASACSEISVAAAPVVAPAVEKAARSFNAQRPQVGGGCAAVTVTPQDPKDVAEALARDGADRPDLRSDAWIPDSSLWIARARASAQGARTVRPSGMSIARSPLVLAMPEPTARALTGGQAQGRQGQQGQGQGAASAGWRLLLPTGLPGIPGGTEPPVRVGFPDPSLSAAGMGALLLAHRFSGSGEGGLTQFAIASYAQAKEPILPEADAYEAVAGPAAARPGPPAAVVLPEQYVWSHRAAVKGRRLLTAVYPPEGSLDLDFPYVLTTTDARRTKIAERFRSMLGRQVTRDAIHDQGLRTPDGIARLDFGVQGVVRDAAPTSLPLQDAGTITKIQQMWQQIVLGARMLVLLDVSGSMAQIVPGSGVSRMTSTTGIAATGLRMFSDRTRASLWLFATDLGTGKNQGKDYREAIPFRGLADKVNGITARELGARTLAAVRPVPGAHTALYNTILDGFRAATKGYTPDQHNIVVVMTDGKNDDPGQTISLKELVGALRSEWDPDRPVSIIPVAFGPDIQPEALREIAKATHGEAYVTKDPREIQKVFLSMLIRVTCGDQCPIQH